MFIPGETVMHEFIIPFVAIEVSKIVLTYKQADRVVLTKSITSGFEEYEKAKTRLVVSLSQQETLLFENNMNVKIQLNVYTDDNARAACTELNTSTGTQQHRQVITNE